MRISERIAVERILKAIADPENAKILVSVRKESKSAQTLGLETGIPQSTVYRKLEELKAAGLVMTERFEVTSGKKVDFLVATFSELRLGLDQHQLVVDIVPSDENANLRWLGLFRGG